MMRVLPEPVGRRFCAAVGWSAHWLVGRDRRIARHNLTLVHPDWPAERVRAEAKRVFEEIGRNVYDFVRYPQLDRSGRQHLVEMVGREHLDAARERGRGALIVTGHLGSWELVGAHLSAEGYPLKALARPLREPRLDTLLNRHRAALGVDVLSTAAPATRAARHLREGGFLGILIDQRVKRGGLTVRFLGQPTRMVDGPARLALATGAAVVPVGIRRLENGRHRLEVRPEIPVPDREPRVQQFTQAMADALGGLIARSPEQWMWIHPRWEQRPGVDGGGA